jgi:hypothetical protein
MKETSAMLSREGVERAGQGQMEIIQSAGGCLAQMRFEFGKSQFNGIEIGAVRRQVADANPASREQPADVLDFVSGEVVEDERIARAQLRTEHLLKISGENLGIDGAFDQKGRCDAFMAQSRNEGGALPVAVRDSADTTLAHQATTMVAGHLGVQTGFVNKHQLANIPTRLLPAPKPPGDFNVRPILLGGARRFFYSSDRVVPSGAIKR